MAWHFPWTPLQKVFHTYEGGDIVVPILKQTQSQEFSVEALAEYEGVLADYSGDLYTATRREALDRDERAHPLTITPADVRRAGKKVEYQRAYQRRSWLIVFHLLGVAAALFAGIFGERAFQMDSEPHEIIGLVVSVALALLFLSIEKLLEVRP